MPTLKPRSTSKVNVRKAIEMKSKGIGYRTIAKTMNVTPSAVHQKISPIFKILEKDNYIKEFREKEIDILDSAKLRFITAALNDSAIKKSSSLQLTTAYSQLFDKKRLLNNEATQNINIHSSIQYAHDQLTNTNDTIDRLSKLIESSSNIGDTNNTQSSQSVMDDNDRP